MQESAHDAECHASSDYVIMLLKYLLDVMPDASYKTFAKKSTSYLSQHYGGKTMTIAEMLREEGRQ